MSTLFPQDFREAVRAATDIVSLVGESVALQGRAGGREYVGLCCFHDDHNPSMVVYPDRQTFRCWSCNTGGDVFTFVMEREKLSFREALEILARRAGLEIPQQITGRSEQEESNRARLFEVVQWAENLFQRALWNEPTAERARNYLFSRGYNEELIRDFRLGYHPPEWDWLQRQARNKYPLALLQEARLIGERDGRHFDYFVDRVLFTIRNERGQPVAFGGRVLPGSSDDRKYFNSPESPIFHKSRLLYGIDRARDAIRQAGSVLITEGYTDCITCHQYGVRNVVATLGTALTDSHVLAIKRYARQVILIFDGDEAGQSAAARAVERFLSQDIDLRILTLPDRQDPAEFLAAHGAEALRKRLDSAPEAWEFSLRAAQQKYGLSTISGRQQILEEMVALLAQVPQLATHIKEGLLVANLAQRLGIAEPQVRERLKQVRQAGPRRIRESEREVSSAPGVEVQRLLSGRLTPDDRVECEVIELILADPERVAPRVLKTLSQSSDGGSLEPDEAAASMRHPALRSILERCLELTAAGEVPSLSALMNQLSEEPLQMRLLVWLDSRQREKNLNLKLQQSGQHPADGCPKLLRQALNNLMFREQAQSHQQVVLELSRQAQAAPQLDPEIELLLRQSAEFNKRRATQRQE